MRRPTEYSFKAKYLLILGLSLITFKTYKYYYKIIIIIPLLILLLLFLLLLLLLLLDVNECKISNGGCEHRCKNKNGGYLCECNNGFFLDGNGKTCSGKLSKVILKKILLNNLCETQMRGNLSSMRGNSRYILFPNLVAALVNCLFCSKCFWKEATKKIDIPGFCLLEEFLKMLSKNTAIQKTSESF